MKFIRVLDMINRQNALCINASHIVFMEKIEKVEKNPQYGMNIHLTNGNSLLLTRYTESERNVLFEELTNELMKDNKSDQPTYVMDLGES